MQDNDTAEMKRLSYIYIMTFLVLLAGSGVECHAQRFWEKKPIKTSKTKKESRAFRSNQLAQALKGTAVTFWNSSWRKAIPYI